MMLQLLFFVLVYSNVRGHFYDTNITDLSKCKVHYSRSGSVYKDFYEIGSSPDQDDTLLLDFHFAVLAPSDAHIMLSPSETVEKDDPVYEIVIGAGGNTFCDIRRKPKSDVKASVRIKGLLSALDPNSFWIHITKDGVIDVGKDGDELPFISWIDPDPLPLKVISFSTWSGIEAKWYFDCERWNQTEELEQNLTHNERLRKDLLYHYDPYVRPVKDFRTMTEVSFALSIEHVRLDEHNSKMAVIGVAKLEWHDEKLKWDPVDYGEMEALHIFRREIWQPDLCLFNSVNDARGMVGDGMMVAQFDGHVEWNPAVHMEVWCHANGLETWPANINTCKLMLGIHRDVKEIQLYINRNSSSLLCNDSEWSIIEAGIYSMDSSRDELMQPAVFEIMLTLKRNSNLYNTIFLTPFVFIAVSLLATFWMDPFGSMKISLCCFELVATTVILLSVALVLPIHSNVVPYLVSLYSRTLVASLIAAVLSIVVINLCRNIQRYPLPHILSTILTSKILTKLLYLPQVEGYMVAKSVKEQQKMWVQLAIAIDRLSFGIYLALITYAICGY